MVNDTMSLQHWEVAPILDDFWEATVYASEYIHSFNQDLANLGFLNEFSSEFLPIALAAEPWDRFLEEVLHAKAHVFDE